jgi:hypothetical protein
VRCDGDIVELFQSRRIVHHDRLVVEHVLSGSDEPASPNLYDPPVAAALCAAWGNGGTAQSAVATILQHLTSPNLIVMFQVSQFGRRGMRISLRISPGVDTGNPTDRGMA